MEVGVQDVGQEEGVAIGGVDVGAADRKDAGDDGEVN